MKVAEGMKVNEGIDTFWVCATSSSLPLAKLFDALKVLWHRGVIL